MPRITHKEIEYKESKVKGLVDKVTAKLSGSQSGIFTKLAERYKHIDQSLKELTESREKLNDEVKERAYALFDAEDEILTRVVETVSLTVNVSKRTPAGSKEVERFDTEKFINEIYELMPELTKEIDFLVEKCKVISEVQVPAKSPALRVTIKEYAGDDVLDKIEEYAKLVAEKVFSNLNIYDEKIMSLAAQIG